MKEREHERERDENVDFIIEQRVQGGGVKKCGSVNEMQTDAQQARQTHLHIPTHTHAVSCSHVHLYLFRFPGLLAPFCVRVQHIHFFKYYQAHILYIHIALYFLCESL